MSTTRDRQQFRSYCVEDPAVDLVIDTYSGAVVEAQAVLSGIEGDINKLRVQTAQLLADDNPQFLCALCHVPVYIVSLPDRHRFFFRHRIEDGRCSALTRGPLSEAQINAIKYDGQKEGPDHRRIKEQIRCSLECDPDFSDVQPERYLPGTEPGTWRRPDVSGLYRSLRVCFEAQLSTTFLHVMAERRNFYLKEHAALIWVFKEFPRDSIRRRLLYDDIFYTNNRNVFIVDERTLAESRQQGRFVMLCLWQRPSLGVQPAERADGVYGKATSYDPSTEYPHVLLCRKGTLSPTAPAPADQPSTASWQRGLEFGWYGGHPRTTRNCNQWVTGADDGLHPKIRACTMSWRELNIFQ